MGPSGRGAEQGGDLQSGVGAASDRCTGVGRQRGGAEQCGWDGAEVIAVLAEAGAAVLVGGDRAG